MFWFCPKLSDTYCHVIEWVKGRKWKRNVVHRSAPGSTWPLTFCCHATFVSHHDTVWSFNQSIKGFFVPWSRYHRMGKGQGLFLPFIGHEMCWRFHIIVNTFPLTADPTRSFTSVRNPLIPLNQHLKGPWLSCVHFDAKKSTLQQIKISTDDQLMSICPQLPKYWLTVVDAVFFVYGLSNYKKFTVLWTHSKYFFLHWQLLLFHLLVSSRITLSVSIPRSTTEMNKT